MPPSPEHERILIGKGKQPERPKETKKPNEPKKPKAKQPASKPPAAPSQPAKMAPKQHVAPGLTVRLPLHHSGQPVPRETIKKMDEYAKSSLAGDNARDQEKEAKQAQYLKEAEEQGLSKDDALSKVMPLGKQTHIVTEEGADGKRVTVGVKVTDMSAPEDKAEEDEKAENGEKPGESNKAATEPTTKPSRTTIVFPNDASNERLRQSQEAKKAQQLAEATASAAKPPAGPSKTETKPSAPASKPPSYPREWFRGQRNNECKMSQEEDIIQMDIEKIYSLWEEYFGSKGIQPECRYPFEVCVPASRGKFFFGAQGSAIPHVRDLCLAPVRIYTEYIEDQLYISLWFPVSQASSSRVPRMAMVQMYAIIYEWSVSPEKGLFFDKMMAQEFGSCANQLSDAIIKEMREGENSIAAQEAKKAKAEEAKRAREQQQLAIQRAEELRRQQLAEKKEEKKQWLLREVDDVLNNYPSDTDEKDQKSRSKAIRTLVAVEAKDEGLYGKDVGLTKSEVWTIISDHWSKERPAQAKEPQAMMYSELQGN